MICFYWWTLDIEVYSNAIKRKDCALGLTNGSVIFISRYSNNSLTPWLGVEVSYISQYNKQYNRKYLE